jgi:hypothetical protein
MRLAVSLALLAGLGACNRDVERFPIGPGTGGGGSNGTMPDSPYADGNGSGSMMTGRVCLINDARTPTTCASSGADGLTVALGTATATTAGDGSFMIASPSGTGLVWRVTGTAIYSAAMQVTTTATIPAISLSIFEDMIATNQAIAGDGTGSVIARFTTNGSGVSNLEAATSPEPVGQYYYDGPNALTWDTTATSSFGVVWVPALIPGFTTLNVSGPPDASIPSIPVFADTVTFAFATIP